MRKHYRTGAGPLVFLSVISAVALGSYLLWKPGLRSPKTCRSVKEAGAEKAYDVIIPARRPADDHGGLNIPQPPNGTVFVKPGTACIIPFTVEVNDANNYFIFLKYLNPPENAVSPEPRESDKTGGSDIGFFAAADASVSLNVPVGTYSLMYACGKHWSGLTEKFGSGTEYYKAKETLTFFNDRNRLYGKTIQLLPHSDCGGLSRRIDPSDFPD